MILNTAKFSSFQYFFYNIWHRQFHKCQSIAGFLECNYKSRNQSKIIEIQLFCDQLGEVLYLYYGKNNTFYPFHGFNRLFGETTQIPKESYPLRILEKLKKDMSKKSKFNFF